MSKFSDWEFMLDGDSQEFRQRASEVGSYYFNLYDGVDHWLDCQNDDFRMTTLYLEGETDADTAWQIGYELISLFNGASILFNRDYRRASIVKLLYQEAPVDYVAKRGAAGLLGNPPVSQNRITEEYANGAKSSIKFPLIHLATEKEDVYFILKYLDMESSWTTYYKLMEAVETFAKDKNVDLAVSGKARKAFTNTANNFSLSGFDSRHGFKEMAKKNNTEAMSIDEGYNFVADMAKTYLQKVYFPNSNNS